MLFTCAQSQLADGLGIASKVVGSRSPKKILQDVKIVAGPEGLEILATDLEIAIRFRIPLVDVDRPGEVVLPASEVEHIVREIGSAMSVTMESGASPADEARVVIRFAEGHFELLGDDPKDFPELPGWMGGSVAIPRDTLNTLIERTVFATAREKTRYAINGVLFDLQPGKLQLVGTDGRRLAMAATEIEYSGQPSRAIVPTRALEQLRRLIALEEESEIALQFGESLFSVSASRAELAARIVEGEFAPYQRVIPNGFEHRIEFDRGQLLGCAKRAAVMAPHESRTVRMEFGNDRIVFRSYSSGVGQSEVTMPVEYAGEPFEISLNPDFLIDALKVADRDKVVFEATDSSRAVMLRLGDRFEYIVMPITQ